MHTIRKKNTIMSISELQPKSMFVFHFVGRCCLELCKKTQQITRLLKDVGYRKD